MFEPVGRVSSFGKTAIYVHEIERTLYENIAGTEEQYYSVKAWNNVYLGFI